MTSPSDRFAIIRLSDNAVLTEDANGSRSFRTEPAPDRIPLTFETKTGAYALAANLPDDDDEHYQLRRIGTMDGWNNIAASPAHPS